MIPDLPGYGNSKKAPSADGTSVAHSKRELGKDILEVVDVLFGNLRQFVVYGHDRGARVAYSMTVNYPERVVGLAVLDIVPTLFVWDHMRLENGLHEETHRSHHWVFLSSPSPLPETLIASNPDWYYRFCMNSWMGGTAQNQPAPWIDDSIAPYLDEAQGRDRIKAACEDYRAGATIDIQHDAAANIIPGKPPVSESAPIRVPLLVLYSEGLGRRFDVKTIWASLSQPKLLTVAQVETLATCGHFVVNEAQKETGKLTQGWLEKHWKDL
jgi:haloacetate dehalogenase